MSTPQAAADGLVDGAGDKGNTMTAKQCHNCGARPAYWAALDVFACVPRHEAGRYPDGRSADTAAVRIEAEYSNRLRDGNAADDAAREVQDSIEALLRVNARRADADATRILDLELRLGALEAAARAVLIEPQDGTGWGYHDDRALFARLGAALKGAR